MNRYVKIIVHNDDFNYEIFGLKSFHIQYVLNFTTY